LKSAIQHETTRPFELISPGVRWFRLYLPSPRSALSWRECITFSAICHLEANRRPASPIAIARMTGLDSQSVPGILSALREAGLLAEDLLTTEPPELSALLATRRTPRRGHFTEKLEYYRCPRIYRRRDGRGNGLQPYDVVLLALFDLRSEDLRETTVGHLAECTGIRPGRVRASLARLEEHGLRVDRYGADDLLLGFEDLRPGKDLFGGRKKRREPTRPAVADGGEVPTFLADFYFAGRIRRCDIEKFTALAGRLEMEHRIGIGEWHDLLKACWSKHASRKLGHLPMTCQYAAKRMKSILARLAECH
jgi:DNA-binding transcriptional ArsR family regulator